MSIVGNLHEIIIYVQDMQKQVAFYRDKLELDISYPGKLDDYSDQIWVTFRTGGCTLALHGGSKIDFGKDAPKFIFRVDDIEASRTLLINNGVPMGEILEVAPGIKVCNATDPEGNKFAIEWSVY